VRILLASNHRYPASVGGMAGARVLDCLAKGLAEAGHSVFCRVEGGAAIPPPKGVELVRKPPKRLDIIHAQDEEVFARLNAGDTPWVRTCHVDVRLHGREMGVAQGNWIYVSRTLAETYGSDCYVLNGIDPAEYYYSEAKGNYFLFMAALERARVKGLDIAIEVARAAGVPLVVAGSSWDQELVAEISALCTNSGCGYAGEVYGAEKARLFAEAKALLFPTQWNESFGLVIAEALMSGTPVIASDRGACPELVTRDVGFVCSSQQDYLNAVARIGDISPRACREKAMRDYHYRRMTLDYVRLYERFIASRFEKTAEAG
jgi:glycosyltransferase involved in cell wall biosynthesis